MVQFSEYVSLGHPDKIADYISQYLLDRYIEKDPDTRYAVEVQIKNFKVTLGGEVSSKHQFSNSEIAGYVREAVNDIGYTREEDIERIRRRKIEIYPTHFNTVRLNEPLWNFVQDFRAKGGKAWVVSTGHRDNVTNAMRYLGIEDGFDGILTSEAVEHSKPAPDCFLKAMEIEGVTPAETLIFEDSEVGIEAARRSGAGYFVVKFD